MGEQGAWTSAREESIRNFGITTNLLERLAAFVICAHTLCAMYPYLTKSSQPTLVYPSTTAIFSRCPPAPRTPCRYRRRFIPRHKVGSCVEKGRTKPAMHDVTHAQKPRYPDIPTLHEIQRQSSFGLTVALYTVAAILELFSEPLHIRYAIIIID